MSSRILHSRVLPTLSLALLAACGSNEPPKVPAPPPPVAQAPKEPPVDVSPVPEPPGLVMIARVNKPEALLKTAGVWAGLPLPGARDLVRSVSNDTLADVVDPSQPVDAAATVAISRHGVDPLISFSLGIKSFDDAKSKLGAHFKLVPVGNGGFKVRNLLDKGQDPTAAAGDDGDDGDGDVCVLAHAAAGARLVCGNSAGVEALTPYLSRTMPRQTWPADVHIEIRPEPVRAPLQEMRNGLPMLAQSFFGSKSPAVNELVNASIGEALDLLDDSQKLTLDGMLGERGIVATSRWEFQGTKSLVARSITDASRADVVPPAFWHLPAETDTAVFLRGADPKLYDHPREILTNLMMEGMDSAGMPDAEKKAVHDLVADRMLKVFVDGGTGIYAKGFDQAAVEKAFKAHMSAPKDWNGEHEARRVIGEQVVGWHLYQASEPIAQVGPILKDWSALWNRPTFAKWMESKTHKKANEMARMRIAGAVAGVTLPAGTVHLEVTVPPDEEPSWAKTDKTAKKSPPPKSTVVHIFAVPDGSNTWLAFGMDEKLVAGKAAQALASAPDTNTIGKTATGLDALKDGKLNGGGFVTIRGFLVASVLDRDSDAPFMKLASLPNKGAAPIVFASKAEAPSANARGGTSTGTLRISREVIDDIVKLAFQMR